jgi:hypothetical protein
MHQIREMMKSVNDPSLYEQPTGKKSQPNNLAESVGNNAYTNASMIYSKMVTEEQQHVTTSAQSQILVEDNIKLAGALYAMKEVLSETISKENSIKLFQEISKIYKKI